MNHFIYITPMKSSFFYLFFLILPYSIFSQSPIQTSSINIDSRLYDVFEKDYLEKVRVEDPFLIQRWHFYLDNAFFISDTSLDKNSTDATVAEHPSVQIAHLDQINILKLEKEQNLKHDFYTETIYKIAGTDKFLVYFAGKDFVEKFNTHMKMMRDQSKTN